MDTLSAALILFLAALVHGLAGFAFALLAVPLLSFLWPLLEIVPLMALLGLVLNGLLLLSLRRHFQWKRILSLLIGAALGVPSGALFLAKAPEEALRLLLGLTLVIYGLWGLLNPRPHLVLSDLWGLLFGFLAGALGAALNTPGPPVVIYVTLKGWKKEEVKSTLQGFFFLLLILIITSHFWEGLITFSTWKKFFLFAPVTVLGLFLGHRLYFRLSLKLYLRLLHAILILAGILTLVE